MTRIFEYNYIGMHALALAANAKTQPDANFLHAAAEGHTVIDLLESALGTAGMDYSYFQHMSQEVRDDIHNSFESISNAVDSQKLWLDDATVSGWILLASWCFSYIDSKVHDVDATWS